VKLDANLLKKLSIICNMLII